MDFINHSYKRFRIFLNKRYPHLFNFCERRKAIVKFFIAGGFAGVIDLIALFFFHDVFGWEILSSTSAAFILAFVVSFSLQKIWTFRNYSHKKLPRQLVLYFAGTFVSLNLNALGMYWLVNNLEVWYLLSQLIVDLCLGILNFFNYKFIVFRSCKNED